MVHSKVLVLLSVLFLATTANAGKNNQGFWNKVGAIYGDKYQDNNGNIQMGSMGGIKIKSAHYFECANPYSRAELCKMNRTYNYASFLAIEAAVQLRELAYLFENEGLAIDLSYKIEAQQGYNPLVDDCKKYLSAVVCSYVHSDVKKIATIRLALERQVSDKELKKVLANLGFVQALNNYVNFQVQHVYVPQLKKLQDQVKGTSGNKKRSILNKIKRLKTLRSQVLKSKKRAKKLIFSVLFRTAEIAS